MVRFGFYKESKQTWEEKRGNKIGGNRLIFDLLDFLYFFFYFNFCFSRRFAYLAFAFFLLHGMLI